jgi:hypothetical protein
MKADLRVDPDAATGRSRLASPRSALVVGVVVALLGAAAVPLSILSHDPSQGVVVLPFGIVGFVVAWRQSRNPIGWILLGLTLAFLLSADGGAYAVMHYSRGYRRLPLPRAGVFLAAWWVWLLLLLPLPVALFPDGRMSRRWRIVVWVYLVGCALFVAGSTWRDATGIVAGHIKIDSSGELVSTNGGSGNWAVSVVGPLLYVAFCVACVGRQLVSYRHSTGEYRQQLKWLLSGGAISIGGLLVGMAISNSNVAVLHVVGFVSFLSIAALPIGIGVGILKYRLYEIDRLISRTLSYLIITGLLACVFVGIVVLATDVLPFSSPVAVAASTLAAAALFNPLRKRVQHLVDRRFNRARYDAQAIVEAFTAHLREAVDPETVRIELLKTVDGAVQPSYASLWIRPPVERPAA